MVISYHESSYCLLRANYTAGTTLATFTQTGCWINVLTLLDAEKRMLEDRKVQMSRCIATTALGKGERNVKTPDQGEGTF